MRIVIEGTEVNPITVTRSDLTGTNHDFSYFRFVHFTGNWSGHSLRNVDIVESRVDADFRRADLHQLETWHTDCEGIKLTAFQADRCTYDLARGHGLPAATRYMKNVMGAATADIDVFRHFNTSLALSDRDKGSWPTLTEKWRVILKTTTAEMHDMFDKVFGEELNLPLTVRRTRGGDAPFVQELRIYRLNPDTTDVVIPESRFSQPMLDAIQQHNRWELARAAEDIAPVPVVARCRRLNPGFDLVAIPRRLLTHPHEFGVGLDATTSATRLEELVEMRVIA